MAAGNLTTILAFLKMCMDDSVRSVKRKTELLEEWGIDDDGRLLIVILLTTKDRNDWKRGSLKSKAHQRTMVATGDYVDDPVTIENITRLTNQMQIYKYVETPELRMFLWEIFFCDPKMFIGDGWLQSISDDSQMYLYPQDIPGHTYYGPMRGSGITSIDDLPGGIDRYHISIKYDGRHATIFIRKNSIQIVTRGGKVYWASRSTLLNRMKSKGTKRPKNPGRILYILVGELVAANRNERLPAAESVLVGRGHPGFFIVFDCIYAESIPSTRDKKTRRKLSESVALMVTRKRLAIASAIVRKYGGDVYSDDAALESNTWMWSAAEVDSSDIETITKVEEGVFLKLLAGSHFTAVPNHDKLSKKDALTYAKSGKGTWFKYKTHNKSADVICYTGKMSATSPGQPGSLEMFVAGSRGGEISIGNVASLTDAHKEILVEIGFDLESDDKFVLAKPVYLSVIFDYADGVIRHPRIDQFRTEDEGVRLTTFKEIAAGTQ